MVASFLSETLEQFVKAVLTEISVRSKEIFKDAFETFDTRADLKKVNVFSENVGGEIEHA